jgi:hypothetical protein
MIDAKVKGETISLAPAPEPVARVVDLMEALKASLAKSNPGALAAAPVAAAPASAPAAVAVAEADRKPPKRAPREGEEAAGEKKKKAKG